MTTLTSRNGDLVIGPEQPVVLISDRVRATDKIPGLMEDLQQGKVTRFVAQARASVEGGLAMVDILLRHPALDEVALLPRIAAAIQEEVGCPVSLDSRDPAALEAALAALRPYKALINSVTAERESMDALLPLAAKYGAAIIGMPMGDIHGLPKDVEGRLAEARVLLAAAAQHGIPKEDVLMDGICLASSAEPGSMPVALETIRRYHEELGVATVLGVSNGGHGMPNRLHIELAYLLAAIPWGLDAALVNPRIPMLLDGLYAAEFLSGRDPYGRRYIKHYRATQAKG